MELSSCRNIYKTLLQCPEDLSRIQVSSLKDPIEKLLGYLLELLVRILQQLFPDWPYIFYILQFMRMLFSIGKRSYRMKFLHS
jgi:hypothetical protein